MMDGDTLLILPHDEYDVLLLSKIERNLLRYACCDEWNSPA